MSENKKPKIENDRAQSKDRERAKPPVGGDDGLSLNSALFMAESQDSVAMKKLVGDDVSLAEELTPIKPPSDKKKYQVDAGSKQAPEKYRIVPEKEEKEKKPVKGSFDPNVPPPVLGDVDVKKLYDAQPIPAAPKQAQQPTIVKEKSGAYGLDAEFAVKENRVKRKKGGSQRHLYDPNTLSSDEILAQIAHNELYMDRLNSQRKRRRVVVLIILAMLIALVLTFGIAAIVNFTAGFTISLSGGDVNRGLTLYDNSSLQNGSSYLTTERVNESDNITYGDFVGRLLSEIDNVDGLHSLDQKYFAYTFYVVNNSNASAIDYEMSVNILSASKGVDDAVRVLVVEDSTFYGATDNKRTVVVTAKPQADESGAWMFDEHENPVMQQLTDVHGNLLPVQDNAVSFRDRTTTYYRRFQGLRNSKSSNMHKYTVMVYLEGGDPDCKNSIKGGDIKMNIELKVL